MDSDAKTLKRTDASLGRWPGWFLRASSLIWIVFAALACFGLHQEWAGFHWASLWAAVRRIGPGEVVLALAFTFLSYLCNACLGLLAQRCLGQPPRGMGRELIQNFIIGAFNRNAGGSPMGGAGIRQRFAAEQEFPAERVGKVSLFTSLAASAGQLILGGILLCAQPPALAGIPGALSQGMGLLLMLSGLVLVFIAFRPRFGTQEMPQVWSSPSVAVAGIAIAMLDRLFAGLALWVLFPGTPGPDVLPVVTVAILARILASLTLVPGGLGVLELLITRALAGSLSAPDLATALVSYRLLYYILPFLAAILEIGLWRLHPRGAGLGKKALRGWSMIAPRLASWLALGGGFILLLSANTPIEESRRGLVALLPLPFVEASHFISSLAGALLIVLARGLQRRIETAWWLSVAAMMGGVIFSLVKGFDWEEALVLAFLLVCLLSSREYFHRHAALWTYRFTSGWWLMILSLVGATVWMGFFAARNVPYRNELWWHFALKGDASRFLRALIGSAGVFVVVALAQALRPAKPRQAPASLEPEVLDDLVRASDHSDAALAWLGDKQFALSSDGRSALMYADQGNSRIVMGDPLGDSDAAGDLLWQFVERAQDEGMRPVFFQISVTEMPRFVDMDFKLYKLGEEAHVPLMSLTLEGAEGRKLRHARSRFQREGLTFAIWKTSEVVANIALLRSVSDIWLAEHRAGEKSFSLGRFESSFVSRFPCGVVKDASGRVVAFSTLWLTQDKEEFSVDLMRHLPDTPNGVMEAMFVEIMLWGREQGYRIFNLGMAPLSGLSTHPLAPMWHQIATLIFRRGESLYNFQGLRSFKEKFNPVWEPRYLAIQSAWTLPSALIDVTAITGGGLRRTFGFFKT